MAIKGKGRTKTKQVARAPRREPVPVKAPFFTRRWVQVLCGTLVGAAVVLLAVWVFHGLNKDRANSKLKAQAVTKLAAGTKWRVQVVTTTTKAGVGTPSQAGSAPTMFAELDAVTTSLKGGKSPKNAKDVVTRAVAASKTATTELQGFDMNKTVTGQGFSPGGAAAMGVSQELLVEALKLYNASALVTRQALAATGSESKTLARTAESIRQSADSLFATGWSNFQDALLSAGITTGGPNGIVAPPSP